MPQPTGKAAHVDAILSNMSVGYQQDNPEGYVSNKVFPEITVDKKSNKYYVYPKGAWFRDEAKPRSDSAESAGSGYDLSTDLYNCDVYAFHKDIGDQARANADSVINLDADATRFVTSRLQLRKELQWMSDYFTSGVWGATWTGGGTFNKWSDYENSDPVLDIKKGIRRVKMNTGFTPNKLVLGYDAFQWLTQHPDIIDRIKYTSRDNVTEQLLAAMFGVAEVMVASGIYNAGNEGATDSMGFAASSTSALLVYAAPSPGLLTPSGGYTFVWQGVSQGMGLNIGITKLRDDFKKMDRVEGEIAWDNKLVASDLGVYYAGATDTFV